MKDLLILFCLIGASFATRSSSDELVVNTPNGKVLGSTMQSRLGRDIYAFRGMRYADPPVGQQRFQVARPVTPWNDVLNATVDGPRCPGLDTNFVSEDCLRLNVYATKLPSNHAKAAVVKRPVLVFFHPGGFYAFTGRSDIFGPQYLMDKNIVLVMANYRLASLGFLSTGDSLAPGNLGLKDQVEVLRWIQRNIASFGGDPNCVTIFGYSAGSMSVLYHMVSPMSRGLFHRAIAMSAGSHSTRPMPTHQRDIAYKQAELLGCPTDTTGSMLLCLLSKPVEDFTRTVPEFFEWHGYPTLIWSPVVEPEVPGVERFLPAQPFDLIRQGKINQVPLIAGVTKDEFGGAVTAFDKQARMGNLSIFDDFNENWQTLLPLICSYERDTPRSLEISRELRRFYFNNEPLTPGNYDGLADILTDSIITFAMHRTIGLMADNMQMPVYFYKSTFQGRRSFAMWNDTTPYGVAHHDDLQYLFYIPYVFQYFERTDPEIPMLELMTSIWENFMITGEPIPRHKPKFENITWDRYNTARDNYLNFKVEPVMETGLFPERMQEWNRLFPIPPVAGSVKH